MPVWPVLVQSWEWECCGAWFAVGDRVAWTLLLDPRRTDEVPLAEVAPDAVEPGEHDGPGHVVRAGGLTAWIPGARVPPRALLVADRHDGVPLDLPHTQGTVRRIRVVATRLRPSATRLRGLEGVPGTTTLRDVDRLPALFASPVGEGVVERGAVVDLEVG